MSEGLPELATHTAVQDEVDGAVDEHRNVEHVAERNVHFVEDAVVDSAEERQHALRQLGRHEAQDDGDQHRRRAGVLAVAVRLFSATGGPQPAALGGGPSHRRHEQAAQHRQQDARHHFEEDPEQPEIDGGLRRTFARSRM